jgi:hypothetical protein
MAVTFNWFDAGKVHLNRVVTQANPVAGTVKVILLQNTWTPSQVDTVDDITSYEANGTNYARATLSSTGVSASGGEVFVTAGSVVFSALGDSSNPVRYLILAFDSGNDTTSPVLAYIDFGANKSPAGSTLTINWNASGVYKVA